VCGLRLVNEQERGVLGAQAQLPVVLGLRCGGGGGLVSCVERLLLVEGGAHQLVVASAVRVGDGEGVAAVVGEVREVGVEEVGGLRLVAGQRGLGERRGGGVHPAGHAVGAPGRVLGGGGAREVLNGFPGGCEVFLCSEEAADGGVDV
jgi:hypothetical protein